MFTKGSAENPRLALLPYKYIDCHEITNALSLAIQGLGDLFDAQFAFGVLEKPSS